MTLGNDLVKQNYVICIVISYEQSQSIISVSFVTIVTMILLMIIVPIILLMIIMIMTMISTCAVSLHPPGCQAQTSVSCLDEKNVFFISFLSKPESARKCFNLKKLPMESKSF